MQEGKRQFLSNRVLAYAVLAILFIATALTVRPFLPAILWSVVLAIAASPLHDRIARRMPGRPRLPAVLTSVFLTVILLVPAIGLARGVVQYTPGLLDWVERTADGSTAGAPDTLKNLPVIGPQLSTHWETVSREGSAFVAHFEADIKEWLVWALQEMAVLGVFVFELAMAVILAGIFLTHKRRLSEMAHVFFDRIGGPVAVEVLNNSIKTTRGTVRGVVGDAVLQALAATFAYILAGVPAWLLLAGLTFLAALTQIGSFIVWVPVSLWLLANDQPGWAIFVFVWGLVLLHVIDNIIRPMMVSKGTDIPGILIFVGVLGGLVSWGLIGVFIGPVVLAVAYELIQSWFRAEKSTDAQ